MGKKYLITNTSEGTYDQSNPIPIGNIELISNDQVIFHDHDGDYVKRAGDTMFGSLIPTDDNVYSLGAPDKAWRDIYVGPGSLYVNGKKVIEDVSDTMNFTTSLNQNLAIKTSGVGGLQLSALGSGNVEFNAPNGLIQFKNTVMFQSGSLIRSSNGTPFLFDDSFKFSPGEGISDDLLVFGNIIKSGGLSTEFLKADGTVDSNLYLPLNLNNKIPEQYLPESVLGKVEYKSTWDPNTNTPNIGLASESKGHYYIVTTPGTFETIEYNTRDWIISNGVTWEKVDNTELVSKVFGRIGDIVAQESDYELFYPKINSIYNDPNWISNLSWAKLLNTPTTISGYGITDSYNKLDVANFFSGTTAITGYNKTNWDTAFGWGDHSQAGYLLEIGDHNHDTVYVKKAGDTMTGSLNVDGLLTAGSLTSDGHRISALYIDYHSNSNPQLSSGGGQLTFASDISLYNNTVIRSGLNSTAGLRFMAERAGTPILFNTSPVTNGTFVEGMRINGNGDVGIGISSTLEKLHVNGYVLSTGFKATGSSNSYVLLAGGGTALLSGFSGSGHTHSYNDLTDKPTLKIANWDAAYAWGDFRDYGLGVTLPQGVGIPGGNCNSITIPNGLYKITASTLNSPVGGEAGTLIVERSGIDNYITQKAQVVNTGDIVRAYIRHYKPASSTWTPWRRLWTTEDFTITNVGNWNNAYGWGDHSLEGYLKSTPDYTGVYEPVISPKGTAFNKNFGTTAGTVAEGNDTRILNGATAFGWGNHASAGYLTNTTGDSRYVNVAGDTMTGNLRVEGAGDPEIRVKTINSTGRGRVTVENSDGNFMNIIATGPNYIVPNFAGFSAKGLDMIFVTDETDDSGGIHDIVFSPGGYANIGIVFKPNHFVGIGAGSLSPTEQLTVDNNVLANKFIKRNGTSEQFLMADGSIRTSDTVLSGITVTDDNTNLTRHQIATIQGTALYETVGEILQPVLTGNILNVKFKDGDGVVQSQPVDLSGLVSNNSTITNASYDASTNIITITEADGTPNEIDLSEFSILTSTDANGILTLKQEKDINGIAITKLVVSKVGQTGQYADLLGKPTIPSQSENDERYVNVTGDTMTGSLTSTSFIRTGSTARDLLVGTGALYSMDMIQERGNSTPTADSNVDLNLNNGNWKINAGSNVPEGGNGILQVFKRGAGINGYQMWQADAVNANLWFRANGWNGSGNSFGVWKKFWDSSNFTNLNQLTTRSYNDLQDKPTVFDQTQSDARYVKVTGDTISGDVTINAQLKVNSGTITGAIADTVMDTVDATVNDGAHFDYVIKREDAVGMRTGTVMAVWDGTNVAFTDTSTQSLGGVTTAVKFTVTVLTGVAELKATISGGTWTIKVATRIL